MKYNFNEFLPYIIKAVEIIAIIVCAKAAISILSSIVDKNYNKELKKDDSKQPIEDLIKSLIKYSIYIIAAILILLASGITFKDVYSLYSKDAKVMTVIDAIIKIVFIFIVTRISIKIFNEIISVFFEKQKNARFGLKNKKADTLSGLFKNMTRYILFFIAIVMSFDAVGVDIRTFIAVTSVAGVAVGLGAQSLIKDVISGFFILFEDQFAVGDYITIGNMSGIVENLGLRITKVRDFSGDLYIIPNGSIDKVINRSRGSMRALVDVNIAYNEDIDKAVDVLKDACRNMKKECSYITAGPEVIGISKIGEEGTTIRITARTRPMKQWDAESELRRRVKYAFDKNKILMGNSQKVTINYEVDKNGNGI